MKISPQLVIPGLLAAIGMTLPVGCADHTPPPLLGAPTTYLAPPPPTSPYQYKPLPDPRRTELPPPPFDDVPLVYQRLPEAQEFVRAYHGVGDPRIVVFVNRTLDGVVIPPANPEQSRRVAEFHHNSVGGPGFYEEHTERSDVYLRPGQYDEVGARSIDYQAIEAKLADWLACDGQVKIVSPTTVRQRLTEDQVQRLQQGQPRVMADVAKNLDADVLVQVQVQPTEQSQEGLTLRLIAEVINIGPMRTGDSIARAVVPVPPPLDIEQINKSTRFVARKLMSDMTGTWGMAGAEPPAPGSAGPSALPPPGQPFPPMPAAPQPPNPLEQPQPPAAPLPPTAPVPSDPTAPMPRVSPPDAAPTQPYKPPTSGDSVPPAGAPPTQPYKPPSGGAAVPPAEPNPQPAAFKQSPSTPGPIASESIQPAPAPPPVDPVEPAEPPRE